MTFTAEELMLAEPQPATESALEAWYMDTKPDDQRLPHKCEPNRPCPVSKLRQLGVLSWRMDPEEHETDPQLAAIRKVRNYSYTEIVTITPEKLPNYNEKIKQFYEEHTHSDEEIRYVLDGSGYFDVRDENDQWIRIRTVKGDMIVLPEGIYHRFTLDSHNYIQAMRLFVGEPVWTPLNRPVDHHPSRLKYVEAYLGGRAPAAAPKAKPAPAAPKPKKRPAEEEPVLPARRSSRAARVNYAALAAEDEEADKEFLEPDAEDDDDYDA